MAMYRRAANRVSRAARAVGAALTAAVLCAACGSLSTDSASVEDPWLVPANLSEAAGLASVKPADSLVVDFGDDLVTNPVGADPTSPAHLQALDLFYDGLTKWDAAQGAWVLDLAVAVTETSDGLTWTFDLDPQAAFTDGTPLTAVDVARSLQVVLADTGALVSLRLDVIEGVTALDDHTVEIQMRHPDKALPAVLSSPLLGVTPAAVLDGTVGSGDYTLATADFIVPVDPGSRLPDITVSSQDPHVVLDPGDSAMGVAAGELRTGSALVEVHYGLNVRSPKLSDALHRQLVASVVDQEPFAGVVGGSAIPIDEFAADPKSCATDCGGPVLTATVAVPDLYVDYVTEETGVEAEMAEMLAHQLRLSGVPAEPRGHSLEEFSNLVAFGAHEIYRTGWVGLAPELDGLLSPYLSGSPDNISGYDNPVFDGWLAAARRSGESADYQEALNVLVGDVVVIPLVRLSHQFGVSDEVVGLEMRPDGTFDVSRVFVRS
jgi:ABC-type transport system substrate-binding protein